MMTSASLPMPRTDWALFLDFDGTLVEIADAPDAVRSEHHLLDTLKALSDRLGGALAIVSGRPIAEIDAHLDHASFAVAGLHGLEMRLNSRLPILRTDQSGPGSRIIADLHAFADSHEGLLLEDKGVAVALHYRNRPELESACIEAADTAVAGRRDLQLLHGKMVVEIKPAAGNKGRAVRRFMQEPQFAGRLPVFAGDDVTDEDGFRVAQALGGFGIKVGEGDTAAQWRIDSVSEFLGWLAALANRLGDPSAEAIDR